MDCIVQKSITEDFVAIAELATSPNVFAVKPELGVKTMKELVAFARDDPDKFNISTPPVSTTPYLGAEPFKVRESLPKVATLAFTGGGEAFKALLSGTVQLSLGALGTAHPHIASGAVTASPPPARRAGTTCPTCRLWPRPASTTS
jgi:tripartite-type tricarboxylate transporter receptor subunit TctC